MIELLALIACVVMMMKIAGLENQSPVVWGVVTAGLCVLCMAVPLPYVRVLLGLGLSFGLMTGYNMMRGPA